MRHKHAWEVISLEDTYNEGEKKILRRCSSCKKLGVDIVYPAHKLELQDIPRKCRNNCMFHRWKTDRLFDYSIDVGMGTVKCTSTIQVCKKCDRVRCRDISKNTRISMSENLEFKDVFSIEK